MKPGIRWIIRVLILFTVIITPLNNPLLIIDPPRDGYVVHAAAAASGTATGPALPRKQEILALLQKANSWQLAHPVMKPDDRNWQRGTWYTGVMAAWKSTHDPAFLNQALAWGRQHQWQVGTEHNGANRLFCVETWAELYLLKKDSAMIEPAIKWLATPDPRSPGGAKQWYLDNDVDSHNKVHGFVYVDSLYGAPALAMLARATGDNKYIDLMNAFFDDVAGQLLDKESGLYYRDPRFIGQRTANGKKILWSRGNGWAFAGTARVLEYLPKHHPSQQHYLEMFRRQAAELVKRQGADGLWRVNLDDPDQFPNPETSGTGFFCFGLAWGINHGVLNRKEYLPAVEKAWAGLTQNLGPEGKVLGGQQEDGEPHPFAPENPHEYVTGTFLLSGSEVYKLAH
jgi:rhamnogalacturonyl hydrolase YesR